MASTQLTSEDRVKTIIIAVAIIVLARQGLITLDNAVDEATKLHDLVASGKTSREESQ